MPGREGSASRRGSFRRGREVRGQAVNITTVEYLVILTFWFILGSVVGSLLNVCIWRLPRHERIWDALKGIVYPPSHCPRCKDRIPFYLNVPIFGWLLLRGRCRRCRGSISPRYPLIELLTGLLFALLYWCEIPDWWRGPASSALFHPYGPLLPSGWLASNALGLSPLSAMHCRYGLHLALLSALIVATFIDFDLKIIPDSVTLPAMTVGVLGNWLLACVFIVPLWYQSPAMSAAARSQWWQIGLPMSAAGGWLTRWLDFTGVPAWIATWPLLHGLLLSVAGIVAGGGLIWGVRIAGQWGLQREAMGFGDVVLLAMIGSFLGWQGAVATFFMALVCALAVLVLAVIVALAALLAGRRLQFGREIPFGPYLSLGAIVLLCSWRWVWPHVESILALGPILLPAALGMFVSLGGLLRLVRAVQVRMGYRTAEPELVMEWTAGDQLAHFAGEWTDDRQGQWPRDGWPGTQSGRGLSAEHGWRRPEGWRQDHLRRGAGR